MIINELQMEDFLKILRDYFRSLKLTQQEIAERTNITQAHGQVTVVNKQNPGTMCTGDVICWPMALTRRPAPLRARRQCAARWPRWRCCGRARYS